MLDCSIFDQYLEAVSGAPVWYVGFSGGLDSTVLLHLAAAWRADKPQLPPLRAIHINHQMQAESDTWQAHCQSVCDQLGVPLEAHSVDVAAAGGGEAGARRARYEVFEQCIERAGGGVLLLAHHQDDQVETFFLRLLRGSGVDGLSAIPAQRDLGRGTIIRPLLDVPRQALEAFARDRQLSHVEDPSNADTRMDRNFLRGEVLPLLQTRWPAYRNTVTRAARHIAEASTVLGEEMGALDECRSVTGDPGLALGQIQGCPEGQARRVLRAWIRGQGLLVPDRSVLSEFVRQLGAAGAQSQPSMHAGDYAVTRFGEAIYLHAPVTEVENLPATLLGVNRPCEIPGVGQLSLSTTEGAGISLAADAVLQVRWRADVERVRLAHRQHSTSLKNLFQELSVPPWWRQRIPLVFAGDELLAMGDLLVAEPTRPQGAGGDEKQRWKVIWQRESPPFD